MNMGFLLFLKQQEASLHFQQFEPMKTFSLFLLTFLMSISCMAQDCINWLGSAKKGILYNVESPLKIKLKVFGVPDDAKFEVLVNGKNIRKNQKSDEVPLTIGNDDIIIDYVPLSPNGVMGIQVVMTSSGKTCKSSTLIVKNGVSPNLHILSIGPTPPDISYTVNDATDVYRAFTKQACGEEKLYGEVFSRKIVAKDAGYTGIKDAFNSMIKDNDILPIDVFMLFISSHGNMRDDGFYLQPTDIKEGDKKGTSIRFKDLLDSLDYVDAKKLIFIDACESGGAKSGGGSPSISEHIKTMSATKSGYTIITSSSENERSYYDKAWENGAFTEAFIEGLSGKANENKDEVITTGEIYQYLKWRVPELCEELGYRQNPSINRNDLGDFPFFKIDRFCTSNIKGKTNYYPTIYVNGDDCVIGSPKGEKGRRDDEVLQRPKPMGDFDMGTYEVTNQQYCDFLNDITAADKSIEIWVDVGKSSDIVWHNDKFQPRTKEKGKKPVVNVSHLGARRFAVWLSTKDCEYKYKLPTEAQWECAARDREVAAHASDFNKFDYDIKKVHSSRANKKGIHGMTGNVAELTATLYREKEGAKPDGGIVVKGLAVNVKNREQRIANKERLFEKVKRDDLGFRLIKQEKRDSEKCQ